MSALNFAMDAEVACFSFYEKALGDAIAGRDHTEALRELDKALSELRVVEAVASYFAARLGCQPKDVWYVLYDMTHNKGPGIPGAPPAYKNPFYTQAETVDWS